MRLLSLILFILFSHPTMGFATQEIGNFAYSTKLTPKYKAAYYINQGLKYFDTLDTYASRTSKPEYSKHVIRWEWYPWLKLTGYKRWMMKFDVLLTLYPTKVTDRDCRFFETQPFCRCRVSFRYMGITEPVKIYEEFTFNDSGEITFIEAWTDEAALLPMDPGLDPWGKMSHVKRLSTKVPGLGTPSGYVKASDKNLKYLASKDPELMDLTQRMRTPICYWLEEIFRAIREHF